MFSRYLQQLQNLLKDIEINEKEVILTTAKKIANTLADDGLLYVFGCGHSHMLAEEVFYRAGGLVPIYPVLIEDLMLHRGGARSSDFEKDPDFAFTFLKDIHFTEKDLLIVASTSGRNPVPIDVSLYAKNKGTHVVGITSIYYKEQQSSRHSTGSHLSEVVDTVIHNHIPVGDALIQFDNESIGVGPGSSVTGIAIMNSLIVEATNQLLQLGVNPPIFRSGNVDGGAEHNEALLAKYQPLIDKL
ncbi:hypothetical protein AB990_09460 [Alkalihalobacillus pseudalcaliphilus]|nr:hypothetical protein AB990_09460 [Alkalihalobacillus pseudalcaliphilus]